MREKVDRAAGRMRGFSAVGRKSLGHRVGARPFRWPAPFANARPRSSGSSGSCCVTRRLEGLKFRRQVPIGRYVVGFVCLRPRLVVEADRPFHDPAYDAERDAWLAAQGFRVLRFSNNDIYSRDWQVIGAILGAIRVPQAGPEA